MTKLDSLTADPKQSLKIPVESGELVTLTLEFVASQRGWFYSVEFPGWTGVSRRRLVNSPNMLRQFRGVIPFGLACYVTDGHEPIFIDDFSSGRAQVYLLENETDKDMMEDVIAS